MVATQDVLFNNLDRLYDRLDSIETKMDSRFDSLSAKVDSLDKRLTVLETRIPTLSPKWIGVGMLVLLLAGASLGERAWSYVDRWLEPPAIEQIVEPLVSQDHT